VLARTIPVPEGLRLLLGHRLQRLPPESRSAVDLAAVAGRDVDVGLLAAMCGEDEDRIVDAVDEALAVGVLVVDDPVGDRLRFSHALLRQAALDELSPVRRRRLHALVARALEGRHGEDPQHAGEIADHLEKAGTGSLRYLELAGRRSLEVAAYEDAADRFRRALDLVPAGEPGTKARLLAGLGYAQRGLGAPSDANAGWLAALELLEGAGEEHRALVTELSRALGRYLDATGGLDQAVALLERGLRSVGSEPTAERSWLTSALGYARTLQGDVAGAAALLDEAAAVAGALDDDRLRADVLASRTALEFATGRLRDCIATAEAAERALLACGQEWDAVQAKVTTVWPRLWLGRPLDARRQTEESLAIAERVGHVAGVFLARRSTGLLDLVETGDLDRFTASAAEGLAFCEQNRLRWLADAHVMLGLARFWAGDWAGASEHLRAALLAPAPPVYAGRYSATLLTFLAWAGNGAAFDRVRAGIRVDLDRAGAGPTLGSLAVRLAEVEALALLGRRREAAALYPAVVAAIDGGLVLRPPDLRVVEALAGLAAGVAGERALAQGHFERARQLVASLPHPRQAPDIDVLEGVALADDALLARAAEGYRTLGMPGHQARAEGALCP
jgi:tetratricopeptide (TPR) repeat protein